MVYVCEVCVAMQDWTASNVTNLSQFDGGAGKGDPFQGGDGEGNFSVTCIGITRHKLYANICVCVILPSILYIQQCCMYAYIIKQIPFENIIF